MTRPHNLKRALALLLVLIAGLQSQVFAQKSRGKDSEAEARPVIWRNPGNIRARDLRYGPGSYRLAPQAPFTFIEEDKSGESPKFDVKDARGITWRVKLGPEAQSETVATRLVWAVGYFAEEAYYFDRVQVLGLPKLSRGREYVGRDTRMVYGARFEPRREDVERGKAWEWNDNPFEKTRELSGLKVLMILLNNFDARAANNRIFYVNNSSGVREARYTVSDLGATLGKADGLGGRRTKNNLKDFLSTRFVTGTEDNGRTVEFDYDTRPTKLGMFSIFYPPYYRGEVKKEKNMRGIPTEHARWIGSLLSQLTDEQLRDAFRAAGYNRPTMDGYVRALRQRINQLTRL
ncbi:MAG TPA: hypothetical protein VJS44_13100 [Pyrinomonadaceae bacterium]|nr:hypothetical protein [Pyrinomonadaceae bacterium]